MLKKVFQLFSKGSFKKYFLIALGTVSWSLTMIKSGWSFSFLGTGDSGIGFWGANGHDGVWHIALAESLAKGSFVMPVFSGVGLQNYHIGFDLILAALHKITTIPILNLYFQILPIILALLIGFLTYKFVYLWTKSEKASFWSTFFVYFGGDFSYFFGKGESAFWSTQAISTLINPPFALSLIFILIGTIYLKKYLDNNKVRDLIICSLFFGILIGIKVYAGLLILGGLFISGFFSLITRRQYSTIKVFLGSLMIALPLYFFFNRTSSSLVVWQPFWFLENMMGLNDRVGWQKFYSAMITYKSGQIWIKGMVAYFVAFLIFVIGNFGTRILLIFRKIKLSSLEIVFYSIVLAGILIPTFFLQKGTPWNTIQFFYYSLFFSGILAGITLSKVKSKLVISLICLLTIPTTALTLKNVYLPTRPPAMLASDEISALSFLSTLPDGVVLTFPFDQVKADAAATNPPRPLYLYTSTAYVSAFSKHHTFLEDEANLDITDYDWKARLEEINLWYGESDEKIARRFLKENNIKYVYWFKDQKALLEDVQLGLKNIFENSSITIYQVEE